METKTTTKRIKTRDAAPKVKEPEAENLPATIENNANLPAFLAEAASADAGKGVSTAAEDNLVPLIYILQAQSPQSQKRNPDYVEGGESGAIWLRNSGRPAINGEVGILFQPSYFYKNWAEWILRSDGGGFAGVHDERPADAEEKPMIDDKGQVDPDRTRWIRPNGHEVIETRYHVGNVYLPDGTVMPFVIPMAGSAHTASRAWMFLMGSKTLPGGARAPSWAALYRLKTKLRSNKKGEWMTWDITDAGWVQSVDDYKRGAILHESFAAGELKAAALDESQSGAALSSEGDGDAM